MRLELGQAGIKLDGRWLVKDATLSLAPRSLTGLVGPNGSGKTTLLRLLGGLWSASAGRVMLDGEDINSYKRRDLARRIAFTPQDTHLGFAFTVRDVVGMGRHPHLGRFERESARDRAATHAAMVRADVLHLAERFVTELSGGERQRVVIARALATEAEALLLDEPVASLDIGHALNILELCRELAREGKTILVALHDLNLAARYAGDVVLMSQGQMLAAGASGEVLSDEAISRVFGVQTTRTYTPHGETALFFHRQVRHDRDL